MKLLDLSQPIWHGGPNCPLDPPIRIETPLTHPSDGWQLEILALASHTGSHLDAPLHKVAGGQSISDLPLETFVGRAFIADLRFLQPESEITPAHLQALPQVLEDAIILLATGWGHKRARSDEWFYRAPFLGADAATWIVEKKIRGVGIDHYSIGGAREPANARTHEILLSGGVWIVEDLLLSDEVLALPQPQKFWALPINLKDHSGAWCRPVLEVDEAALGYKQA